MRSLGWVTFEKKIRYMLCLFALISVCASGMVYFREWLPVEHRLHFLLWNLFLAWVPLMLAYLMLQLTKMNRAMVRTFLLLTVGAGWLVFLPNATDLIHFSVQRWWVSAQRVIDSYHQSTLWYDLTLMAFIAMLGMGIGFAALFIVHMIIRHYFGRAIGWLFVLMVSGLSGFGVYLGRFVRWNSWDLMTRPVDILVETFIHIHRDSVYFSSIFAVYICLGYLLFYAVSGHQRFDHSNAPVK